tara:strand:+ start:3277 stop:3906 length:630 start_codon:yes stop_codon:yes gene_type:complete
VDLSGRHLLVSHAYPRAVAISHEIAQTVLLDNGAFSVWRSGKKADWAAFYNWTDVWLDSPTTWAIIPDVIDAGEAAQDELIKQWPHGKRGSPVWHMDEPIDRLLRLTDEWPRVCVGSAGEWPNVGTDSWHQRMTTVFNQLAKRGRLPWIHGLRMQGVGHLYPYGSVDSADIARNNNRPQNSISKMVNRWDSIQPKFTWEQHPTQQELMP